ncbi:MAG TPA: YCF48-related protein, partial [Candidatus Paceibacterota bacterium]|nr:YCF48-related protein [Candidatus Paceibacterota bacterium]
MNRLLPWPVQSSRPWKAAWQSRSTNDPSGTIQPRISIAMKVRFNRFVQPWVFTLWLTASSVLPLHAQPWQRLGTDNHGIVLVDDRTIVVVGTYGKVLRSTDGGARWTQPASGMYAGLYSVAKAGDRLVAVGDSGVVLISNDAGITWSVGNVGVSEHFHVVVFPTSSIGYACGTNGTIIKSTDGGRSWERLQSGTSRRLWRLAAIDSATVVAVGDSGTIVRTTSGGSEWSTMQSATNLGLYAITFAGRDRGLAAGERGVTVRTENGGATWEKSGADSLEYGSIDALWAFDSNGVVAVGTRNNNSKIAQSSNWGTSWDWNADFNPDENIAEYTDVVFQDALHGFAVGLQASIKATDDGGATWRTVSYTPFNTYLLDGILDIAFVDRDTGAVLFGGSYLRTTDGGVTWNQFHVMNFGNALFSLCFPTKGRGLIVGSSDQMFVSTDQGRTWNFANNTIDPPLNTFESMSFADENFGVFSVHNRVYVTSDAGRTWKGAPIADLDHNDSGLVFLLDAVRPGVAYVTAARWTKDSVATTYREIIFRTVDSGAHWANVLQRKGANMLKRSWFLDPQHGFVGGSNGIIYHTDNGGDTWDSIATGAPGAVSDIRFFTDKIGYAVTFKGAILSSSDGGRTWQHEYPWPPQPSDSTQPFYRVNMLPDRQTIMVTGNSLLLRKVLPEPLPA